MFTDFIVSEICLCLNGDRQQLHQSLDAFAEQVIERREIEQVCQIIPEILGIILEHEPYFHSVCNWGEVYSKEEDAAIALSSAYDETSSKYASLPQRESQDIQSGWLVITLSFCYSSSRSGSGSAIETEIRSIDGISNALREVSILAGNQELKEFNIHWSPAEAEESLTEDQVIEYYPDLIKI